MKKKEIVRYRNNPFALTVIKNFKNEKRITKVEDKDICEEATKHGQIINVKQIKTLETIKLVDKENFVKIFADNIAEALELTRAGQKSFNFLLWQLQKPKYIDKDVLEISDFDYLDYVAENKKRGQNFGKYNFWKGIRELEQKEVIAKYILQGQYFINPSFIFNGNRTVLAKQQLFINTDTEQGKEIAKKLEAEAEPNLFNQPHLENK